MMLTRTLRCSGLSVLLATVLPAQQVQPSDPLGDSSWLAAGTRWHYLVTQRGAGLVSNDSVNSQATPATVAAEMTVTHECVVTLTSGEQLHQLRVQEGELGPATLELWSITDTQVLQHATRTVAQRGQPDLAAKPMQLWSVNRGEQTAGQAWQWIGPRNELPGPAASGNAADALAQIKETGGEPALWRHQAETLGLEDVVVPAGRFAAQHVRMRSERDGEPTQLRDLWFAKGVGVVKEVRASGSHQRTQQLQSYSGQPHADTERLLRHLDEEQRSPKVAAFNNAPRISWLQAGPEALLIAGRIAVVHTDSWQKCYLVGEDRIRSFDPTDASTMAPMAMMAFASKSALPPEGAALPALALLLARSIAALHQFGHVHEVPVTLPPKPELRQGGRLGSAQIIGGALDGSERNIAVWLRVERVCDLHVNSDLPAPKAAGR